MGSYKEILCQRFPLIDSVVVQYVEEVMEGNDDFATGSDVYDAVGEVLHELARDKSEDDIREICQLLYNKVSLSGGNAYQGSEKKILDAPVQLEEMANRDIDTMKDINSIWMIEKGAGNMKVNARKLEKAEAKLQQKQEKRQDSKPAKPPPVELMTASASQMISKKDNKLAAKGVGRNMDFKIENFDISFGDKVLLVNADLNLAAGRRYGLVGRNGLGKTTLLRMISSGQLQIPPHITVLHVEQEVVGDDTLALDSVLEQDTVRTNLLRREKELLATEATEELADIYRQLQEIEADKAPAKASVILSGLGFTKEMQIAATKTFSGGWRMRLALARALFSTPDLLLLDEPTNMLDIKAIIWLENYLQTWPNTLIVVSHDRNFLDTVPTDILYLHSQRIDPYKGNYEQFEKTKTEKYKAQKREYDAQMANRAHVQEFIDRFRYNANRAASVQSKIKMLEKLPELQPVEKEPETVIKLPDVEPLNPPILMLTDVAFAYDRPIFKCLNLNADLQSRICIVGENGAGKTTLLKIIIGTLDATSGIVFTNRNLKFGYFSQHHVDQLEMNLCCVEVLQKDFPGKPVEEYRRQLGSFGISGDLALQSVASLSGGQKSRVAFAKICMANPNFLILDEPTNHLDIETIDALGKALNVFQGGVILVSHDARLIKMVSRELWVCGNQDVKTVEGGFEEYRKIVLKELEAAAS
ncbi:ATP-binding cassette sub-family F member 3 [Phlebotomus argentipes]|uniref:ATP-binding cassette sub-family F member 3 n=1 Tax=Phlebotomus argentipes TaxID=94469 RepID=UPI0028932DBF|nr:ATP-binding cassette sub-family F member 3 [Phlebotomus argentipes]